MLVAATLAWALVCAPLTAPKTAPAPAAKTQPKQAPRIVVLDVSTDEKGVKRSTLSALSDLVTLELARYGNGGKAFDVLSGRELRDAMKLEGDRALVGCDQTSCAAELAQAFGARYVVFLVLTRLGSTWTLNLSLFDSDGARVLGRAVAQADDVPSLTPALPGAVRTLAASLVPVGNVPLKPSELSSSSSSSTPSSSTIGLGSRPAPASFPDIAPDQVTLHDEPLRALDAAGCSYDDAADRFTCGARPVAEVRSSGTATTAGELRVSLGEPQPDCVATVDVELESADQPIAVDWRDAVFIVNGVVVASHPQTALDHAMNAPAGVVAKATLVPAGATCAAPVEFDGTQDFVVSVPFFAGAARTPSRAVFVRRRAYRAVDERALVLAIARPVLPAPPPDLVDSADRFPAFTVGAAGTIAALGVGAGVCTGALWLPKSATLAQRADVGAGWGAVCAGCALIPVGAAGVGADVAANFVQAENAKQTAAYRRAERMRAAWRRLHGDDAPPDNDAHDDAVHSGAHDVTGAGTRPSPRRN